MSIKVGKSFKALIAAGAALVMAASMALRSCGSARPRVPSAPDLPPTLPCSRAMSRRMSPQ